MKKYQVAIVCFWALAAFALGNYFVQKEFQNRQKVQKEVFAKNLEKWEKLKKISPTYRDAYVKLALGYMQLGLILQARQNLQQALSLDPNLQVPGALAPLLP
jgi:tetratricopeptide (TPR) repeat protein